MQALKRILNRYLSVWMAERVKHSLRSQLMQLPVTSRYPFDVEGHELEVLNGAVATLSRFKPLVLFEIEGRHHKSPITTVLLRPESLGYKDYFVNPETLELLSVDRFDVERDQNMRWLQSREFWRYLNNFFFIPESSEKDFMAKGIAFLEMERRLARQPSVRA